MRMHACTSSQVWISYADRLEQPGDIFKVRVVWEIDKAVLVIDCWYRVPSILLYI